MLQDGAGYLLVCTEHGIFTYDGRRFVNLGPDQGLRQGGFVNGLSLTATGRIAVGFADELLVSDRAADPSHPPSTLAFHPVRHPGISLFDDRLHRFAPWQDGLVLLAGADTVKVVVPGGGSPHVGSMGYDLDEQKLLQGAVSVFSVGGQLWEAFADGRLCLANPGAVECYAKADGLVGGPWIDVIGGPDGQVLARSASSVATFDPLSGRWSVVDLPDQGDRYLKYLGLFRTPGGELVTQAEHGLAIFRNNQWQAVDVEGGAPSGTIVSAMSDGTGQFWLQVLGRGLVRWVGYGQWETIEKADGLSDGFPWISVRLPGGSMWVATDTGINEIVRQGSHLRVGRVIEGTSFALAVGQHGELWSSFGLRGARIFDPSGRLIAGLNVPPVDAMVPDHDDRVWLGTEAGLFRVDGRPGRTLRAVPAGSPPVPVPDLIRDGSGGVLYLSGGRLRHRHADGQDGPVGGDWPTGGFQPLAMAADHDGLLWIGGPGGLFRFSISNDHISSYQLIPTAQTQSNSILAIMVDHRGWVWAGTTLGVSVFDGERWVSVDADGGLLSNDVDQGGLREDPDGSVWIATSHGLSHLLQPDWLFTDHPITAVVSGAMLGSRPVLGQTLPYTRAALAVQFGTPNYGAERSVIFRYRLSGVDAGWVETTSGVVRYPFVPPGRHLLTVVGYDALSHRVSPPASLMVDIAYPWWRQWWSETLWVLAGLGLFYGATRLRFRRILAHQTKLERHVAAATEQLRYQAAHDSLTGLLNRCEIEKRLAATLSGGSAGDEMIVALVDVDHFKAVNDNHGHLGGDDVLRAIGRLISRAVREGEHAGRYGGEEILLLLDDSDGSGAERVLDLHRAIRHDTFKAAGTSIHVTCSIGVAWAAAGDDWESLVGRADDALYEAKSGGRDRVVESRRTDPAIRSVASSRSKPGPA